MRDGSLGQELPQKGQHRAQANLKGPAHGTESPQWHAFKQAGRTVPLQDTGSYPTARHSAGQVPAGRGGKGVELHSPTGTGRRSGAIPVKSGQQRGSCRNSFQACERWLCRGRT